MTTKEIDWKIGGGKIIINIDDRDDKLKILSISSTANSGITREQIITIKLTQFPNIQKNLLVRQIGVKVFDCGHADTEFIDYDEFIDCSVADSEYGTESTDVYIDCGAVSS